VGKTSHMGIATWIPVSIPSISIQTIVSIGIGISIGISISISRPFAIMETWITKDSATNIAGSRSRVPGNTDWVVQRSNNTMGLRLSRPLAEVSKGMSVISISIAWVSINSWAYITAGKTVWVVGNPKTISIITIVSISIGISIRSSISISIGIPLAKVVGQALDASMAEAKTSAVMGNTRSIAISTSIRKTIKTTIASINTIKSIRISICIPLSQIMTIWPAAIASRGEPVSIRSYSISPRPLVLSVESISIGLSIGSPQGSGNNT